MELKKEIIGLAKQARDASRFMVMLSAEEKNRILKDMAVDLVSCQVDLVKANKKDILKAKRAKMQPAMIDRLTLTEKGIADMAESLIELAKLSDPVGEVIKAWRRPNGLWIHKVRTPIGVIAIIYEARPNVTSDCIGLSIKSGNCVILKGGSDAINSNLAIFNVLNGVLKKYKIPEGAINLIASTERKAVDILLKQKDFIDLVIPRGGESLINRVVQVSTIPVIKHYKGICHVFVDEWADLNMAQNICYNAKVQRPGVCNAMESMLVHRDVAARFLPGMIKKFREAGVEIRGCVMTKRIVKDVRLATEKDYRTEYLGLILSVK
ncbi:MAG: glutamate-5-semialdehyde dehydrogenase, partial [Candidatus Omnitrophica bacterium]|nr:glutamate-5-semialdehyde dehydrogenase [Candidatus Omnitrophota bacterium]